MESDPRKTLAFLYIAKYELWESREFAEALLRSGLLEQYVDHTTVEHRALDLALIVSYARPFSMIRGYGQVEPHQKKALGVLSSDETKTHDTIMSLRDQEYAHSDADANDIEVHLHGMFRYDKRYTRSPLNMAQVQQLTNMIDKLIASFHEQSEELRQSLLITGGNK